MFEETIYSVLLGDLIKYYTKRQFKTYYNDHFTNSCNCDKKSMIYFKNYFDVF